jgi:hypothetical protein
VNYLTTFLFFSIPKKEAVSPKRLWGSRFIRSAVSSVYAMRRNGNIGSVSK